MLLKPPCSRGEERLTAKGRLTRQAAYDVGSRRTNAKICVEERAHLGTGVSSQSLLATGKTYQLGDAGDEQVVSAMSLSLPSLEKWRPGNHVFHVHEPRLR